MVGRETDISVTTQRRRLYAGPFFPDVPMMTDLYMERTSLRDFSSFWLGSFGSVKKDSFYRSESSEMNPAFNNRISIFFTLSLNQRIVVFTRYSVIDVL